MSGYILNAGGPVFNSHTIATKTWVGPLSVGVPAATLPSGTLASNWLKAPFKYGGGKKIFAGGPLFASASAGGASPATSYRWVNN